MIRLILILLCGVSLQAHSLKVFASQDGDFVVIKSYFYGNSPCRNCNIDIIKDDKIIQNSKTDENGVARLKLIANEFDILVDDSLTHEKRISFSTDTKITIEDDNQISKFIYSLIAIILIFGILYLIKRK